jgi:hypothetical protein
MLKRLFECKCEKVLITVTVQSRARTVLDGSHTEIEDSNPTRGMSAIIVFVLPCVGENIAIGRCPIQGVQRTVCKIHNFRS